MSIQNLLAFLALALTAVAQSIAESASEPSASQPSASSKPTRPFDPRMPITIWHDGGQLPFIQPLTPGWSYRNGQDPKAPWRLAPGDTWASQQPADVFEFGWRNSYTQLRTSSPGQAVSILTTCPKIRVQGELQGAFVPDTDWSIILNDEVLSRNEYSFNSSSAFLEVSAPRNSGVFNVTIQLESTFRGTLGIKGVVCTTMTQRPSEPSLKTLLGQTGNRLSFVNGTEPQDQFQIDGTAAVDHYILKDNETVPVLVLRGDTVLKYQLPPALTHLQLRGFVGPNYGRAKIALDPPAPIELPPEVVEFSTNRSWFSVSSFFSVPLDAAQQYTLSISTDAATAAQGVYLDMLTVLLRVDEEGPFGPAMFQPEKPPKRTNVGAIVGGVVGGVAVLLIAAFVVWYIRRRRPRAVTRYASSSGSYFEVDEAQEPVTPSNSSPTTSSPTDSILTKPGRLPPGAGPPPPQPAWRESYATVPAYPTPPPLIMAPIARGSAAESPNDSPTSAVPAPDPAKAPRRPRRPRPPGPRPVVQEDDGGTLLPEFVPPRYNPEWALRRESQQ